MQLLIMQFSPTSCHFLLLKTADDKVVMNPFSRVVSCVQTEMWNEHADNKMRSTLLFANEAKSTEWHDEVAVVG
jgi:hypothetical protein